MLEYQSLLELERRLGCAGSPKSGEGRGVRQPRWQAGTIRMTLPWNNRKLSPTYARACPNGGKWGIRGRGVGGTVTGRLLQERMRMRAIDDEGG